MSYKIQDKRTKKSKWRDVRYYSILSGKLKKTPIYRTKALAILDKNSSLMAQKTMPKSLRAYKVRIISCKPKKKKPKQRKK